MLTINKVVIHELSKEPRINEASTYLSSNLLDITANVETLLSRLDESYTKDVINYAVFNTTDGRVFPSEFATYMTSGKNDADFLTFSKTALNNLRDQIRNVTLAKGGFFIFAEYVSNGVTFVAVYLVRDTEGVLFKRIAQTHSFEVDMIKYMNTDKLAMGCRVNNTRYLSSDGNYLSLIKNKQIDISEYFYNWIGIQQAESSTEFTNTLYEIINSIELPLNPETSQLYSIDEFKKIVVDYVRSQPSRTVNLLQMGLHFYENDRKIIDFATENNLVIDHEFRADSRALKRFVSVMVNADGINLKFSRGEFDRKVKISPHNVNMIIIESERFANALRSELNRNGN